MDERPGSKLILLAFVGFTFIPAILATLGQPWPIAVGGGLILIVAFMLGTSFFFPEQTVIRFHEWSVYRTHRWTGELDILDAKRLVARYLPRQPGAPTTESFKNELIAWTMIRSGGPDGDPACGKAIVRWYRRGHDLALLRNALAINVTASELRGHMSGKHPFDVDAIATLAALQARSGPTLPPSLDALVVA